MIESDAPSIETIRAKQRANRNGKLGALGVVLTAATSLIVQLVQVTRADADKALLTEGSAHMQQKLDDIERAVNALSQRVTAVEVKLDERTRKP